MRLRRLCLAIFAFLRFLSEPIQFLATAVLIQSSNLRQCKSSRSVNGLLVRVSTVFIPGEICYLLSRDGPAGALFFSCVPMPIFFRNGSIHCLRPSDF